MRSLRVSLIHGVLSGMIARLWTLGGWLVLTPWILGQLGAEAFGLWSLVFVLGAYLAAGDLGLSSAVTRTVAESATRGDLASIRTGLRQALGLYLGLAVVCAALVWKFQDGWIAFLAIPARLTGDARWILELSPLLLLGLGLQGLGGGVLAGLQRTDLANRNQALASIPTFAGVILCLVLHLGVLALFGASLLGIFTAAALNWVEASSQGAPLPLSPALPSRSFFLGLGWLGVRIQIITLAYLVHFQVDKLLLAHFRGLATVSEYEIGSRLAMLTMSFLLLALPALVPASSRLAQQGRDEDLRHLYLEGTRLLCLFALPLTGLAIAVGPTLIEGWLGAPQGGAALTARVILAGFAVNVTTGVGTAIARGSRYVNRELVYAVAAQVLHVALSLWLIPRMGLIGALIAQLAAYVAGTLLFFALIHGPLRVAGTTFARVLFGPVAVGLITLCGAGVALRILANAWPEPGRLTALLRVGTAAGFGLLLGVAAAWAIRAVRAEDLQLLRAAWKHAEGPSRSG